MKIKYLIYAAGFLDGTVDVWRERKIKKQYPEASILRKSLQNRFKDVAE